MWYLCITLLARQAGHGVICVIKFGLEGFLSFISALREKSISPSDVDCIATIGGVNGDARETMTILMQSYGFMPRSLIHHSAIISPFAEIGNNVQLLAGSIIGAFASVGDYSIINSGANVDHDCNIGKRSHLAPRAALAGEVVVGEDVFVGTNAVRVQGVGRLTGHFKPC